MPEISHADVTTAVTAATKFAAMIATEKLTTLDLGFVCTVVPLTTAADTLRSLADKATPARVIEAADYLDALAERVLDTGEAMTGTRPQVPRG